MPHRHVAMLSAAVLTVLGAAQAADKYPTKPIRVLAGGAAGGPIDIMGRIVAQKLSDQLGQTVVIDNRGGAGGTLASRIAAQGTPDGYTLLCNSSQYVVAPSLYRNPGYDPFRDFRPIINAGVSPNMLFVHPSVPANTLQELIALGRTKKLSYGSAGTGSTPHLTGERVLKLMAGLDVTHVPYSSAAPAMLAVAAGQVPVGSIAMPPTVPFIKSGKIRGIAVTSPARMPSLPDVATVAEQGFPGYEDYTWIGFFAPMGTPRAIVAELNRQIGAALRMPDTKERLATLGFDPIDNTPEQFTAYIKIEVEKWAKVIKESGARVD
ncbi:MAG: Bug family tripartite tricarboxylate transporter substrate binding protein [Rhodospirillaceae bacterium]